MLVWRSGSNGEKVEGEECEVHEKDSGERRWNDNGSNFLQWPRWVHGGDMKLVPADLLSKIKLPMDRHNPPVETNQNNLAWCWNINFSRLGFFIKSLIYLELLASSKVCFISFHSTFATLKNVNVIEEEKKNILTLITFKFENFFRNKPNTSFFKPKP